MANFSIKLPKYVGNLYSRYNKNGGRRKSQIHGLEFAESGLMPTHYRTLKMPSGRDRSYGVPSPAKFNPLSRESPLMRINKREIDTKFFTLRSHDKAKTEPSIPNIRSALGGSEQYVKFFTFKIIHRMYVQLQKT